MARVCKAATCFSILGLIAACVVLGVLDMLAPAIVVVIAVLGVPMLCCCSCQVFGLYLQATPQTPIDKVYLDKKDLKFFQLKCGRTVEYSIWGSTKPDAKVHVICPGSGGSAYGMNQVFNGMYDEINVKGICVTYAGYGQSDVTERGQLPIDWVHDLEELLAAERIDKFSVEGASLGSVYAAAVAYYFKDLGWRIHVYFVGTIFQKESLVREHL